MRVYLDTSVYNRLYDEQTQLKVILETSAVVTILELIASKIIESVNSTVLQYENIQNPNQIEREAISEYLKQAAFNQPVNEAIRQRAKQLEQEGIKPVDALHVACFETAKADYFITCDKRLLNRCKHLSIKAVNPIDFIQEIDNES